MTVPITDLISLEFHVSEVSITGIMEIGHGVRYNRENRPYSGLVLSTGGKYTYYYQNEIFAFEKNDILYLPAGSSYFHIFQSGDSPLLLDKTPYHVLIINFNLYDERGRRFCLQEKPVKLPVNGESYQSIFIDLFHLQTGIHPNPLRRRILVYQLLSSLSQECKKNILTEQFSELIPALEYIQSHPIASIQVNDLIKACYISPTKFRQLFQICEGASPQAFLDHMTLDAACRLLESTQLPFSNISARLGFSSPANFTKYFKKHKFITPTEYRKLYFQHAHTI